MIGIQVDEECSNPNKLNRHHLLAPPTFKIERLTGRKTLAQQLRINAKEVQANVASDPLLQTATKDDANSSSSFRFFSTSRKYARKENASTWKL